MLIVDDHPLFRSGLRQVIESDSSFELIGETGDGHAALNFIQEKKPDVAVLDVNVPGLTGLEIAGKLQGKRLHSRIIILTMHKDEETCNRALDLGVKALCSRKTPSRKFSRPSPPSPPANII